MKNIIADIDDKKPNPTFNISDFLFRYYIVDFYIGIGEIKDMTYEGLEAATILNINEGLG